MPGADIRNAGVVVELDRPRRLRCTFNALADLEEALPGLNGLDLGAVADVIHSASARHRRAALWALAHQDDPSLTLDQAGDLLTFHNSGQLADAMIDAFLMAVVDKESEAEEDGPGEVKAVSASRGRKRGG